MEGINLKFSECYEIWQVSRETDLLTVTPRRGDPIDEMLRMQQPKCGHQII